MPRTPGLHTKGELGQDRGVKGEASNTPPGSSNTAPSLTGFWGRVSRNVLKNVIVDMNGDLPHPGWWFWAPRSLIQHSTNCEMGNKEHKWKDHRHMEQQGWQPNCMLTDRWMNNVTAWVLASAGWASAPEQAGLQRLQASSQKQKLPKGYRCVVFCTYAYFAYYISPFTCQTCVITKINVGNVCFCKPWICWDLTLSLQPYC